MRILHVITSLRTGGAEKLIIDLLPRFKKAGLDVDLLLFDGTDTPFKRQLAQAGIQIYELQRGGFAYSPLHLVRLLSYLKQYDIIHTHTTAPQLFVAICSLFCQTPIVTTEHNTHNRRRDWRCYRFIDQWMYNRYRKIICISDKANDNLKTYLKKRPQNIETVYNGVDIAAFAAARPSNLFQTICPDCKILIMVAAFRTAKDQDTLIRATALLPEQFHAILVGDGPRRSECRILAEKNGVLERVHFLGDRTDVPELLNAADYIIMSSHWEGLSLSSIEGMCVGKPFLASDVNGLHEITQGYGILFPEGDADKLSSLIHDLYKNPEHYQAVADRCLQKSRQYDISVMVQKYMRIYKSIVLK